MIIMTILLYSASVISENS